MARVKALKSHISRIRPTHIAAAVAVGVTCLAALVELAIWLSIP